ncbi:MAG: DUF11 domain-containing protein [Candidatus Methanofastidiosa archaeon]|nr:DUF11 domain-containing protein [Candidatus Methanofastidiosa archaeon]
MTFLLVLFFALSPTMADDVYVLEGQSIQNAINISNPGDTIYVASGTYNEKITINKSITLIGQGETTIVNLSSGGSVTINSNSVKLKGFNIINSSGYGISLNSNDCNITGNYMSKNGYGMWIMNGSNNNVTNNIVKNNGPGIVISGLGGTARNNFISKNLISNNGGGIWLYVTNENIISDNEILSNVNTGVFFCLANYNTVSNNLIDHNGNDGIQFYAGYQNQYNIITNNFITFSTDDGIDIRGDNNIGNQIHQNEIYGNADYGIYSLSLVDATYNWWGDSSGPYHPVTNPSALGNKVSDLVIYDFWIVRETTLYADISVEKSANRQEVKRRENITFTITVTNKGPDNATGLKIMDSLPTEFYYVYDDGGRSFEKSSGIWNIDELKKGESKTLRIVVMALQEGNTVNTAMRLSCNEEDPFPANDVSSVAITVAGEKINPIDKLLPEVRGNFDKVNELLAKVESIYPQATSKSINSILNSNDIDSIIQPIDEVPDDVKEKLYAAQQHIENARTTANSIYANNELKKAIRLLEEVLEIIKS